MLAILSAVLGFAAPFLPELLKYFNRKADNAHEIAMMKLRLDTAASEHLWRMEEISAAADIAEAAELHKPVPSFGVQILDRAQERLHPALWVPVFWLFALLDFVSGFVRPGITWAVVGGYLAYKGALYSILTGPRFEADWAGAVSQVWTEQDYAVLSMVLAFWFGGRIYKAVFGGNAGHGVPGR